ncbi:MAG TPA: hypothetical protein VG055_10785 [Planctomycetaceae bacterium]|jgi:hypothetical protein|nr:hypothetical protein [Planctomycetaceae bacterium]
MNEPIPPAARDWQAVSANWRFRRIDNESGRQAQIKMFSDGAARDPTRYPDAMSAHRV